MPDTTTPLDPEDVPPRYRHLVEQHGAPIGIDEARRHWSELVRAARSGTITLIARQGPGYPQWTALVPLDEVDEALPDCAVHTQLTARTKLGDLVDAATRNLWGQRGAQIITFRGTMIAALIPANALAYRDGERVNVEQLLVDGGSVTLTYHPGVSGATNEDGDVVVDPEPDGFKATAVDIDGNEIGSGCGDTLADALRITRRQPWPPADGTTTGPWGGNSGAPARFSYSDEPPF